MIERYWLKFGFKENGDLTCVRTISQSKPTENFFYDENGTYKEVINPNTIEITKETIDKLNNLSNVRDDKK